MKSSFTFRPFPALLLALAASAAAGAQDAATSPGTPLPPAADPARAAAIIGKYCSACHGWAAAYPEIAEEGRIVPGRPSESRLFEYVESGYMPPSPPAPSPAEIELLRAWIAAGAAAPEAVSGATESTDAGSSASPAAPGGSGRFLGFKSKVDYHRAAGWTSSGLLLAAGVVGAVRAYDLMSTAHDYRDSLGMTEEDEIDQQCYDYIASLWSGDQALRWTHVSLLAAGETLYLGNAITGMSMARKAKPGEVSKSDIHRWAFFTHAALMASEIVMGLFTTDALRRGDHETVSHLGAAHAAVGLAIPLVMIGAGIVIELPARPKTAPPAE